MCNSESISPKVKSTSAFTKTALLIDDGGELMVMMMMSTMMMMIAIAVDEC